MSDLSRKLNRYRDQLLTPAESRPNPQPAKNYQPPERYQTLADTLKGSLTCSPGGAFCEVVTNYSLQYCHGRPVLREIVDGGPWSASAFSVEDASEIIDPARCLFIDTETTGLGGSGAVAFLIGIGRVVPKGFEVRQFVIPDYSDEAAMLERLNEHFADDLSLVSYNGAAFDIPLIRDRMIVNRITRDIAMDRHLDLLHAVRRLFRRRLGDCSLGNIEREVFDFHRVDDIPGYLVPSIYFDWLGEEHTEQMDGVLEHNRLDIVSLYFLGGYLAAIFQSEGDCLEQVDDLHSLARLYGRRKRFDRAGQLFRRIDRTENTPLSPDLVLYHAFNFKRSGDWPEAVRLFRHLTEQEGKEAYWAHLELAKYFEHRETDLPRAYEHARAAARIAPRGDSHQQRLNRRLDRLLRKLNS